MAPSVGPIPSKFEQRLLDLSDTTRAVGSPHGLSGETVDEVYREALVRLRQALAADAKVGTAPSSYLSRVVTSAALDVIRRRRGTGGLTPDRTTLSISRSPSPRLVSRFASAVDALIASRRPIVRMYLTGYDLREITDLLGLPEAETRTRLERGLQELCTALAQPPPPADRP